MHDQNTPNGERRATRTDIALALGNLERTECDPPAQLDALRVLCGYLVPMVKRTNLRPPLPDEQELIHAVMRVGMGVPNNRLPNDREVLELMFAIARQLLVAERLVEEGIS